MVTIFNVWDDSSEAVLLHCWARLVAEVNLQRFTRFRFDFDKH